MMKNYMCLFRKYVFILFLTTQLVTLIDAQAANEVTFNCKGNGEIDSISSDSADIKQIVIQNGDEYCHYSEQTCRNANKNGPLHVIIQSDMEANLVAGKSNNIKHYLLECKDEYEVTAKASPFNVSPKTSVNPSPESMTLKPLPTLHMVIKKGQTTLNEAVSIGQELSLEMSSVPGYKVYPKECTATNGKNDNDDVDIWTDKSSTSVSPCSTFDSAITIEKWTPHSSNNRTTISIYAFQFISSTEVTIRCRAHLCPYSQSSCSTSCMESEVLRRRRRQSSPILKKSQPESRIEEAHVSFRVMSEKIMVQNKANALSVRVTVMITAVIFGERFMRFI